MMFQESSTASLWTLTIDFLREMMNNLSSREFKICAKRSFPMSREKCMDKCDFNQDRKDKKTLSRNEGSEAHNNSFKTNQQRSSSKVRLRD